MIVLFHHSIQITLIFLVLDCITLVVKLLALAKSQFDFDKSVLEVDFEGDKRISLLLHSATQSVYLTAIEQEFASATWIDVVITAHFVW